MERFLRKIISYTLCPIFRDKECNFSISAELIEKLRKK